MALIQFTKNHTDHSTDKGYQFEFFCDRCGNGFMSEFKASMTGLASSALQAAGSVFAAAACDHLRQEHADAAGGGDILIDLPVVRNAINAQELTILATTEPLLFLPWAVKRSMPAKLKESVQSVLVSLEGSDAGRKVLNAAKATGMGKAEDKDYNPHRKMTTAVFGREGIAR
jgi:ABC-type phosphate/phosphonate transport system substrate-binding protein